VKKEISEALMDFYQKILVPEFTEIKKDQTENRGKLTDIIGHFDSVYQKFDRLEDEYHAITHGLKRIEEQLEGDVRNREDIEIRFQELKRQFEEMQLKMTMIEQEIAKSHTYKGLQK